MDSIVTSHHTARTANHLQTAVDFFVFLGFRITQLIDKDVFFCHRKGCVTVQLSFSLAVTLEESSLSEHEAFVVDGDPVRVGNEMIEWAKEKGFSKAFCSELDRGRVMVGLPFLNFFIELVARSAS